MVYFISFVGLIIAFFTYTAAYTKQCPPAHHILPCNCVEDGFNPTMNEGVYIDCVGINNLDNLQEAFSRSEDMPFYNFGLFASVLNYFPSQAVFLKQMQNVRIANCTMVSLFEGHPSVDSILENIWIEDVRFQRGFNWEMFGNLRRLKTIYVINTEIRSLGRSFVESMSPVLESFYLEETKLRKIHPEAFSKLGNLREIFIVNSFVREIKRSMFPTPCDLGSMDFSGNRIATLPEDMFTNMPELGFVNLGNNKISTVSENVFLRPFIALPHFIKVVLENNPVVCDCHFKWVLAGGIRVNVRGQCDTPEEQKGKRFGDLTAEDFNYCS